MVCSMLICTCNNGYLFKPFFSAFHIHSHIINGQQVFTDFYPSGMFGSIPRDRRDPEKLRK